LDVWFVRFDTPWFSRGATYAHSTSAGVLTFSRDNGIMAIWISFRVEPYFIFGDLFEIQWFVDYGASWFIRGAHVSQGLESGVYAFVREYGRLGTWVSFRVNHTMST